MSEGRPPRLAEAFLFICLPGGGYRESVLGDLEEGFHRRAARDSRRATRARWWYRWHAVRVGAGYAARRLLGRRRYRPVDARDVDARDVPVGDLGRTRTGEPRMLGMDGGRMGIRGVRTLPAEIATDVRFAVRWLRRAPGFLAIALLTLAMSIGANAAIFSVVDTVYLEPLPFEEPERLVRMGLAREDRPGTMSVHTAGDFQEWRERTTSFESMAAWGYRTATVEYGDVAERMTVAISVGSLFDVLGRSAEVGRTFSAGEEGPGAENLAVLSHAVWQQAFGGGDVVGSVVRVWGEPHEVIGVMPRDFAYPSGARLWVTAPFDAETLAARNDFFLRTVARLRPEAEVERVRDEVDVIGRDLQERLPETYGGIEIVVEPMGEWLRAGVGNVWWILMGGVTLILLIGCGNMANLLLSRGTDREGELAVRRAMGAGGGRLVRQALTESTLLALAGGALGVLVAPLLLDLLLAWMPGGVPRAESVDVDPGVLVFTLAVSVVSGLLFGALPAARARGAPIGSRLGWSRRTDRSSNGLIVAEVAMSVVLLTAAGLMARSFAALASEDPGIETEDLAVVPMEIPGDRAFEERRAVYREVEERLSALPGIRSVGFVSTMPVVDFTPGAWVNEPGVVHTGGDRPGAKYQVVSPGYFETVGIELQRGRRLTRRDGLDGTPSVLVSRAAADELFGDDDPVGKRFDLGLDGDIAPLATVVGVVGDVKLNGLEEPVVPAVYAVQELIPWWTGFHLMIRLEPGAAIPSAVREVLASVDPDIPWLGARRVEDVMGGALSRTRNTTFLFGLLGLVALAMAAVGVFGVLAYVVGRRTRDIGIRLAIGADPREVRMEVLRDGIRPVALGLLVGVVAVGFVGRSMESLVFGVQTFDPTTLLGVAALLGGVSLLAIYVPAWRASSVAPRTVLESE